MLCRSRPGRHSSANCRPQCHCCQSSFGRNSRGESPLNHHLTSFSGADGPAHGSDWLTEICAPFAYDVSSAASLCRSMTVTACPALFRYHAVVTPRMPAPRTMIFMATRSAFDDVDGQPAAPG